MSGIFNAIKDFFSTIGNVLAFIFNGVKMLVSLLIDGMGFLIDLIGNLPPPLVTGAVALVVVCILYKILGRENQS